MANGDVRNYPHGSGNIRMTTRAELDKLQAAERGIGLLKNPLF